MTAGRFAGEATATIGVTMEWGGCMAARAIRRIDTVPLFVVKFPFVRRARRAVGSHSTEAVMNSSYKTP